MQRQNISEPKSIENECREDEIGSIGAQRLMFVGYWE